MPSATSADDASLLRGQLLDTAIAARPKDIAPDPRKNLAGHRWIEQRLAVGDAMDGVEEVVALDLLQHVPGCAGHDRAEQRLVVGERREDEHTRLLAMGSDVPARLDTGAPRHADIHHHHVGRGLGGRGDGRIRGARLADHLDGQVGLEQRAESAAHQLVVVAEQDANASGGHRPSVGGPLVTRIDAQMLWSPPGDDRMLHW